VSSISYGYDADNNITSKNTTGVAGAGNNIYAYEQHGRLTSWTNGTTTTAYGWDATSNRIKAGTALASYDERNRLLNDGTSTNTYSPRGALLTQTTGTTTEAFSFDAFDRMITRSDRDFTYDALDRPVQAGTARMRYDGFSDEVVSDGTQFFGRSASDGLLSVGYDTTKRLVLADRHGDVIAGFDPTDTTLGTGLPDTRTYDPFGNSTNATGLKYRIGYQGDWTDPRSGDINQGARWYNPNTATFNSRDTITVDGGAASSVLNLYAYAGGNPMTFNDPNGHMFDDPGGGDSHCYHDPKKPSGGENEILPRFDVTCDPPKDEPDCKKTNSCNPCKPGTRICEKGGDGDGDGDGDCKKHCDGDGDGDGDGGGKCKTKCGRKPPPKCDPQCQLNKKVKKEREDIEQDAKNIAQPPPGDPACANGNPALCPGDPTTPATVVTSGGDLTEETVDWSNQQYQDALNQYGSVISNVSTTGSYNWFNGINGSQQCKSADCLGPGFGGPGAVGVPGAAGVAGAGGLAAGGAASGIGDAIAKVIDQILHNAAAGSGNDSGSPVPAPAAVAPPNPLVIVIRRDNASEVAGATSRQPSNLGPMTTRSTRRRVSSKTPTASQ
jgi:RHS repeat-associated protein